MAHQCWHSNHTPGFRVHNLSMSSWSSTAQRCMHLGLLCCFHQHADCILRLQCYDSHASMPGRIKEAIEILHSGHPAEQTACTMQSVSINEQTCLNPPSRVLDGTLQWYAWRSMYVDLSHTLPAQPAEHQGAQALMAKRRSPQATSLTNAALP